MDANKVSAGFMIVSDGLYLLCHTTQRRNDKNIRQFDGQWTVIKGELDSDETLLEGMTPCTALTVTQLHLGN